VRARENACPRWTGASARPRAAICLPPESRGDGREGKRMIISLGKWKERLKFLALFLVFSILAASLAHHMDRWMQPEEPYRKPKGEAVKVFGDGGEREAPPSFAERLKMFYRFGA